MLLLNNTVISAFCQLKRFNTLKEIVASLQTEAAVPEAVRKEIVFREALGSIFRERREKGDQRWLRLVEHEDFRRQAAELRLSEGETAVIILAGRLGGIAVLDDFRARKVARSRGVEVTGSLALLRAGFEYCPIKSKSELLRFIGGLEGVHFYVPAGAKEYILSARKVRQRL